MDSSSPKYPHDALEASWDTSGDLMQYVAPAVEQPSDPWQAPGGDPWRPANATRSHFLRNHDAPDFLPQDLFEPQRTLNRQDLAMPEVPASGFGRPSVYVEEKSRPSTLMLWARHV